MWPVVKEVNWSLGVPGEIPLMVITNGNIYAAIEDLAKTSTGTARNTAWKRQKQTEMYTETTPMTKDMENFAWKKNVVHPDLINSASQKLRGE